MNAKLICLLVLTAFMLLFALKTSISVDFKNHPWCKITFGEKDKT